MGAAIQDAFDSTDYKKNAYEHDDMVRQYKTPNGKVIEAVPEGVYGLWVVRFKSGGELPVELQGMFTTINYAESAINSYLAKKEAQVATKEIKQDAATTGN